MDEHKCRKCGKLFIPAPQHVYKDNRGFYCTWTCYNHKDDGRVKKWRYIELYSESGELLRRFTSAADAAEKTGYEVENIRDACRTGTPYHGFLWKYKE